MRNILKKICLAGCMASLTSCNSIMSLIENKNDLRYEKANIPVEFLLDEGVGQVNVSLSYSLKNKTHRDFIKDYGDDYSKDLFSFVVTNMIAGTFDYQDLYAIHDYKNIYEQNFRRYLKKYCARYNVNVFDVTLTSLHKSPKEPEQLFSKPAIKHLEVITHTKQ